MTALPGTIRARITALAVVLVAIVLGIAGVVLVTLYERQLIDNLDRTLEQRADQVLAALAGGAGDPFTNSNAEDRIAQLLDTDGAVLAGTANLGGTAAVEIDLGGAGQRVRTVSDLPVEDDVYRVLTRRVETSDGARVVVVGENIDDLNDSVRRLSILLMTIIPLVVLILGVLVWWLVGRTLSPVEDIRRRVESIELDQLDERVPSSGTDDEIDRLATTMNAMLDRLDQSADRQRRFVADASHELRSPLTRIRSTLEVDLRAGDADLSATCHQALDDTVAMQYLVDDLLFLARRDEGLDGARHESVDLDVIVDGEVQRVREHSTVAIDQSAVSAAVIDGNGSQLGRLVRNLLDNAVRHARSQVSVSLRQGDGPTVLVIDDDGSGIVPGDR